MPYTSSYRRIYIGIFFVVLLSIILHYLGWLRFLEQGLYHIFVPISERIYTTQQSTKEQYNLLTNKNSFLQNYTSCLTELQQKQELESQNKLLSTENDELKKQLNFIQSQKIPTVLAAVIGREVAGANKILLINIENNPSVKNGQPVISGEGTLIGKISRIENGIAMVRLINDSASKIEASINTALNTNGIVEGGYGISLKMKFVPRTEVVKVDDQVITSGNEPLVPRGLLLGKVEQVQNQASQGFQDISILPVVDLNKLTIVSVLLTH